MSFVRILLRAPIFIALIIAYILISLFWRVWTKNQVRRRHHYTHTVSFFCKAALKLLNFRVHVVGAPHREESFLLVGNHLGFMDIFVLASQHPTLFITSVDMRQTPGIGFLTEMGGCLYVERRSRSNITNEIEEIRTALRQGFSVALYPEGTSSNGERVLPFKKSLLTSAAGTGVPILPMVINYRKVNGEPISHKWRDYVCWYGDQTFFPAMKRILSVKSVDVEIRFFDEIDVHSEEARRVIAVQLQELITSNYSGIPMPQESLELKELH
ncbi:MAG: lysophospholipid acyltransferase family protein [Pseudobdellovibrionaceae bacterium]